MAAAVPTILVVEDESSIASFVSLYLKNAGYAVKTAATRRKVYDMLVAEKLSVQAYHFPFPALARIEKAGQGYRVVPIANL